MNFPEFLILFFSVIGFVSSVLRLFKVIVDRNNFNEFKWAHLFEKTNAKKYSKKLLLIEAILGMACVIVINLVFWSQCSR